MFRDEKKDFFSVVTLDKLIVRPDVDMDACSCAYTIFHLLQEIGLLMFSKVLLECLTSELMNTLPSLKHLDLLACLES